MVQYLIYPREEKRLNETGLLEEIKEAYSSVPFLGQISSMECYFYLDGLMDEGYITCLEFGELQKFMSKKNLVWKIKDKEKRIPMRDNLEQLLMLAGFHASSILSPDQTKDYRRFGFDSYGELVGTIGAYMENLHETDNGEYVWYRNTPSGFVRNSVYGNDGDLVISQIAGNESDIVDPFGNKVSYRPLLDNDDDVRTLTLSKGIDEFSFLEGVLRYISQEGLVPTVQELHSQNMFPNKGLNSFKFSLIPKLDKDMFANKKSSFGISDKSDVEYQMYIGVDGGLILSENKDIDKECLPWLYFSSTDIEDLLKGIFIQTDNNVGHISREGLRHILAKVR